MRAWAGVGLPVYLIVLSSLSHTRRVSGRVCSLSRHASLATPLGATYTIATYLPRWHRLKAVREGNGPETWSACTRMRNLKFHTHPPAPRLFVLRCSHRDAGSASSSS